MKTFAISVERKVVDDHNGEKKSKKSKLLVRAEDASDAVYKAKRWLADTTEKGLDYEVLTCSTNKIREVINDERVESINFECVVEFIPDNHEKSGKKVSVIVKSDSVSHAASKAVVHVGVKQPVRVVSCKVSAFEDLIDFEESDIAG